MANVLAPEMRGRGFALNTMAIHVLGDAPSPLLIGIAKDRVGLAAPVLVTGLLVVRRRSGAAGGARVAAPRSARGRGARVSAYARELDVAARIAREASVLVRAYHGKQLDVQFKGGDEPVSEADHAASALLVARLREAFPDDVVLSEELPDTGERLGKPRVWMVDPIDGTRDFVRGENGFCVMVGLAVDGRPAVGAVGHPLTEHVYAGAVGAGAWREDASGERSRCTRRRCRSRRTSGWSRRSHTDRRASTPSSAPCRSPTR